MLPGGQTLPHDPQFWESVSVLAQVPLHKARPFKHEQLPFTHDFPTGHSFPHDPQLNRSTLVSVQVPLQRLRPSAELELL